MRFYFFILLLFFKASSQNFNIELDSLYCFKKTSNDFLYFKIKSNSLDLEISYLTDLCEILNLREDIQFDIKDKFVVKFDKLLPLPLKLNCNYSSMLPQRLFNLQTSNKVLVIEFSLISHIGITGYNYLIIDYTNKNKLKWNEINFKEKVKNMNKLIKSR